MIVTKETHDPVQCTGVLMSIRDTLDVLGGKWKIAILTSLMFGKKRFKELQREVDGISGKMLSKELRDLEMNKLITRTVYDSVPVTVEYELTPYGHTLDSVLMSLASWGTKHREKIIGKKTPKKDKAPL